MKQVRALRLAAATVLGFGFAAVFSTQAASIALSRKAPESALSLLPFNGLAQESLAITEFLSTQDDRGNVGYEIEEAKEWALLAYLSEPLAPQALAILALSQRDGEARLQIVEVGSELNRREPRFQAVVLQEQVAAGDYSGAVSTLDRILRVRPSSSPDLFPELLTVFVQDGAIEEFSRILDGGSPWHHAFYEYAVRQPSALANLLALRERQSFNDVKLDQALLVNLVAEGEIERAYGFYREILRGNQSHMSDEISNWSTTFAPFEWKLVNEVGLRAQVSANFDELEVKVRPGRGGVVASRLFEAPRAPFVLEIHHRELSTQALKDIDIGVRCVGDPLPILDSALADQGGGYQVSQLPTSCAFIEIVVEARAWSGRQALSAEIQSVSMRVAE